MQPEPSLLMCSYSTVLFKFLYRLIINLRARTILDFNMLLRDTYLITIYWHLYYSKISLIRHIRDEIGDEYEIKTNYLNHDLVTYLWDYYMQHIANIHVV